MSLRPSIAFAVIAVVVIALARGLTPALQGAVVGVSDLIDWMDSLSSVLTQLLFILLVAGSLAGVLAWAQSRSPFTLKLLAVATTIPLCFVALATLALPRSYPIIHLGVCLLSGLAAVVFGVDAALQGRARTGRLANVHLGGVVAVLLGVGTLLRGVTSYMSELAVISHSDLVAMNEAYERARLFTTIAQGLVAVSLVLTWIALVRQLRLRGGILAAVGGGAGLSMFLVGQMPPAELESASAIVLARAGQSLSSLPAPLLARGLEYTLAFLPLVVAATVLVGALVRRASAQPSPTQPRKGPHRDAPSLAGAMGGGVTSRSGAASLALCLVASINGEVPLLGLCLLAGALGLGLDARDPEGVSEAVRR